jgi:acetoin utilization deacetylase AcuC-like enzyme
MLAVDHVMDDVLSGRGAEEGSERHSRVFVIGRPPGHHAGPNGY